MAMSAAQPNRAADSPTKGGVRPLERGETMLKRVFFSFHYQDVIDFRANVVRRHWMTKPAKQEGTTH